MRYLKNLCLGLLVMCMSILGFSSAHAADLPSNCIMATGTASMEVAPDIASVNFNVFGLGNTSDEAVNVASKKINVVKNALLGNAITGENIETLGFYVYPRYGSKGEINGYQANYTMKVTVKDLNKVGAVIDKLTANGADGINNVEFAISNQDKLERQLLGKALEDARVQASVVANAAGAKLGKLLSARINNNGGYGRMYNSVMLKAESADSATVIETKNIKINASLEASFKIE